MATDHTTRPERAEYLASVAAHGQEARKRRGAIWDGKHKLYIGGRGFAWCRICGLPVVNSKVGKRIYCSHACWHRGYKLSHPSPARVSTCVHCGVTFTPKKVRKFCTTKCKAHARYADDGAARRRTQEERKRRARAVLFGILKPDIPKEKPRE